MQSYFGTRFFVPSILLPEKYNYFIKMPENIDIEAHIDTEFNEDCIICMNPLHMEPSIDMNLRKNDTPFYRRLRSKKREIMKAPCNHNFHVSCLIEWMSIKMECPTCRS